MDEQQQLNELKRKMVDTMSETELKASELQQKLNKKMELSKSNAEMGIKRVALEYRVVELEVDLPYPPGFDPYSESDDDEDENRRTSDDGHRPATPSILKKLKKPAAQKS